MGLNVEPVDSVGSRRNVRRSAMKKLISLLAALAASFSMIASPIQDISIKDIDGKDTSLKAFNG